MGDANTPLTVADARHLLRRTGFGAHPAVVAHLTGLTRGVAADELLAFNPSGFAPKGRTFEDVHDKWVKYRTKTTGKPNVTSARVGLQEKLVVFWHDHFATAISVVGDPKVMANQNRLFRRSCKGNFKDLVKAINKRIAMMEFLDTVRNFKTIPNARWGISAGLLDRREFRPDPSRQRPGALLALSGCEEIPSRRRVLTQPGSRARHPRRARHARTAQRVDSWRYGPRARVQQEFP